MSFDICWRCLCVTVCKSLNDQFRIILFKIFCNIVCKVKHSSGWTSEFFIHCETVCTLTMIVIIVLRNGNKSWIFVFLEFSSDICKKNFPHILIGKAELSNQLTTNTFSFSQREKFRIGFQIFCCR